MSIQDLTSTDKLIWWIIGILTLVAGFIANSTVSKVDRCESRINVLERNESSTAYQLKQLDDLLKITREEQVQRTRSFADIKETLALMKYSQETLNNRVNTMSQRILSINRRLNGNTKEDIDSPPMD